MTRQQVITTKYARVTAPAAAATSRAPQMMASINEAADWKRFFDIRRSPA
jgi:hypothetical protein